MPVKKLETVIASHLSSLIDYDADVGESALSDANTLIKLIEKSGFEIARRPSPSTRARVSDRRAHRAR